MSMFKRVYLIDVVSLPKRWQQYFYQLARENGRENGFCQNLWWEEFGITFDHGNGRISEADPEEREFRELMVKAGIPDDPDEAVAVYMRIWW